MDTLTVGQTIVQQIGGSKFCAVTGATIVVSETSITVAFKTRGICKPVNGATHLRISHTLADDAYTLEWMRLKKSGVIATVTTKGVYADRLVSQIEFETGLVCSL